MPLADLLSIHRVDVLEPAFTKGRSLAWRRDYSTTTRAGLKCRVEPLGVTARNKLAREGYEGTHRVRFLFDPDLALGTRIRWTGVGGGEVLRVVPPHDPHGTGNLWVVYATSHSDDNQTAREAT